MPKDFSAPWTNVLPPLSVREAVAETAVDCRPLVIKERSRHSPSQARPKCSHQPTYVLSILQSRSLGSIPRRVPKNFPTTLSLTYLRCSSHFHASDSSGAAQTGFGPRQTRSPPTRHVPQWRNIASSSRSSGIPQLIVPTGLPVGRDSLYRLEIVQHPLKAAEFGTSTLTRLPLAPPLIAQLHYRDRSTPDDMDDNDFPFLIAHLALYNADGSTPVDVIGPGGHTPSQQRLYGNLVSSPHTLRNLQGRLGIYFLFPDVSIRWRGRFQLSVTLIRLPRMDPTAEPINVAEQGVVLAHARSHAFDVYPREEYVAPAQTPLTQYFLQQGVRMYAFASPIQLQEVRR